MAQSEPRIDLCCWKQPLCLLYHNPNIKMFLKGCIPASFSFIFGLLKQFCRQINVNKCSSRIPCWDLNPQLHEQEFIPVTTRPGIPNCPKCKNVYFVNSFVGLMTGGGQFFFLLLLLLTSALINVIHFLSLQ